MFDEGNRTDKNNSVFFLGEKKEILNYEIKNHFLNNLYILKEK